MTIPPDIVRISVHSEWSGMAFPHFWWAEDAEIVRREDRFELESLTRRNDKGLRERHYAEPFPVPPSSKAVERLMSALGRPPLGRPTLENLGLDGESMREEARRLLAKPGCDAGDLRRVRRAGLSDDRIVDMLTDPEALQARLEAYYQNDWTDDHPEMHVRLQFAGGEEVALESTSQMAYMLPWRIRMPGAGEPFETFEVEVTHALVGCLPEGIINGQRLLDRGLLVGPLPNELVRNALCHLGSQHARGEWLRRLLDRGLHWIISSSIGPQ